MTTAAHLVRDARVRSGLTQQQLGEFAGITQSVVSAYESGRREPSFAQLERLVAATGYQLAVEIRQPPSALSVVRALRSEIISALGELGASNVRVFGSVARGDERPDSDVDLLVDIDDTVGLIELGRMSSVAEQILHRPVDVVPASSLKPDVRTSALRDAIAL